ncbi:uncharacterized protein BDV14DRAFT_164565 [Aspergillus stella-maris]|uniref:uncharacterized protein n=1 Tax=Aspergillus stella-maris TaxID=1810926 RepID=UPI003CCE1570
MATNSADPTTNPAANIKREREGSVESNIPLSTIRRLLHHTRPEPSDRPSEPQPQAQSQSQSRRPKHTIIAESRWTDTPVALPAELKAALETWHDKNGRQVPPCKYTYNPSNGVRPSRAFNREGKEVSLTHFNVKAPATYGIAAARFSDGTVRLVSSYFTYSGKFGTYLKAWVSSEKGFEPEAVPSIIRHFTDRMEDLEYQPEAWTELDKRLNSVRPVQSPQQQQQNTTQTSQPSPRSSLRKRTATQGPTKLRQSKRLQADLREDAQSSSEETDSSSSDAETTDESDDEDGEAQAAAQKQTQQTSVTARPSIDPRQGPELLFKLTFFKFTVQHARDFPVEECQTSKALFEKATSFYKILDRNAKVEVLCCQFASRSEQHYLFAGSEGEYSLLVRKAQEVARELGKPLTIEVGLVQP